MSVFFACVAPIKHVTVSEKDEDDSDDNNDDYENHNIDDDAF